MASLFPRRFAQALVAGLLVSASSPALAVTYFKYNIQGQFLTSTGPGKPSNAFPGTFRGTMSWDTEANGGAGGWSQWQIGIDDGNGGFLYEFISPNIGVGTGDAGAGCFSSPLTNQGNSVNNRPYSVGTTGDCKGGTYDISNPDYSVPYAQTTTGIPNYLNIYDPKDYIWSSGPSGSGGNNWFRIPVKPLSSTGFFNSGDTANYGQLAFDSVKNNTAMGWYSFNNGPTASGTCDGANSDLTPPVGTCPYSSSNQFSSGLGATIVITFTGTSTDPTPGPTPASIPGAVDAPGPLPLAGFSLAMVFSRKLRQRIRKQISI